MKKNTINIILDTTVMIIFYIVFTKLVNKNTSIIELVVSSTTILIVYPLVSILLGKYLSKKGKSDK
ncbi:hypothetical protein RD055328_12680 [Companilactobacillus sp. RD055328]|nr:hypothetical protein RD055328_12680 [Companilactobacillus sp. RD055328]